MRNICFWPDGTNGVSIDTEKKLFATKHNYIVQQYLIFILMHMLAETAIIVVKRFPYIL